METAVYEKKQSYYAAEDVADLFALMDSLGAISREAAEYVCEENKLAEETDSYRNIYLLCISIMGAGVPANREYKLGVYRSSEYRYSVFIRIMEDENGGLEYKTHVRQTRLSKRKRGKKK